MDGQRFDEFAKGLGSTKSRRDVLKGVTGGTLAAIGHSGAARPASAATACNSGLITSVFGALARILSSLGIYFPGPPEPPECTGSTVLNPDTYECECALTDAQCPGQAVADASTCECYCPLDVSDCPGGVDVETCTCIEIVCEAGDTPCGAQEFDCTCVPRVDNDGNETNELVCVDHGGPNGYKCGNGVDTCPDGMICAEDNTGCPEPYCYPSCGQAAAFSHIPHRLA